MTKLDDYELLAEFARSESGEAFAALVARHVNLVYSAALRFTGNPHHAEEISQAVFIVLARKAAGLRRSVVLSGWLYQTARLTAANFMKYEIRRQIREQEAYMQSTLNEPDAAAWNQVAPFLDEAMGALGEADRNAVVLRFFENKTSAEVAAAMNLTEATAHKRVARALEKLRKFFAKRGVVLSAGVIAGTVAANSTQAAPAAVGQMISTVALAKGAAAGGSTFILAKGVLKLMAWTQAKTAIGVVVAAAIVGGTATLAVRSMAKPTASTRILASGPMDSLTVNEITGKSRDTYAALTSYSDEGTSVSSIGSTTVAPHTFSIKLARPNLYRIQWKQDSGFFVNSGVVWCAGQGDFLDMDRGGKPEKEQDRDMAISSATGISGGAAASIPGTFFQMNWGNELGRVFQSGKRMPDEMVEGVPCYVVTHTAGGTTKTLWIGRQDFLIRQIENDINSKELSATLDAEAKKHPEIAALRKISVVSGDSKSVQTHRNIMVNQDFAPSDFAR